MGVQRLLANHNNAVPAATITASSIAPASNQVFRQQTIRTGNGLVKITGGYTGQDDAIIEVEIRSASGTAARVSKPVFSGAGNGTMTQPTAANGTATQTVTVTLVDLGTETTKAQAVIYGDVLLRAKTAGSGGNAISITVAPSLTLSASPVGALSSALTKDTQEWTDQKHDFGAVPLNPDGTVPTTAPRLVFGRNTSRVYRHYKRWDGDQWQYGVSPKLAADYAAGSTVHIVTGTYSVTVTNGVTPETYSNLTTLYDFLLALNASALAEAVGVVAKDLKPGGMAAIDLPIRTVAFALPVVASAPDRMPALQNVTVAASAPTETIAVECIENSPIGSEKWAVKSKVSGALANAITGQRYAESAAPVAFTIPVVPRTEQPITGSIVITAERYQNAGTETGAPAVCLFRPTLGAKAASKTLTLVWTVKPVDDCDCKDATVTGGPDPDCLGIDIEEEGENVAIPSWYSTRLQTLYGWRANFITANTAITAQGELRSAQLDIDLCNLATGELSACLADLYAEFGDTIPGSAITTAWDSVMTGLDNDLTPLETLGSDEPTVDYSFVNASNNIVTPLVEGSTYNFVASDGAVHRYKLVETAIIGAPSNYGSPPSHADGGLVVKDWNDIEGDANYVWQDLGPVGDSEDVNSAAAMRGDPGISRDPALFAARYAARMDEVRALAGIVPKSDAGSGGSACWRDLEADHYWVVNGGEYLPVFNNTYWHSCQRRYNPETGKDEIVSTYEVGFGLQISCEDRLTEGDTITISISDVSAQYPYQIGDKYEIPLVAGGPIVFAGGVTGTDTLTWTVKSNTAGALANYALTALEPAYSGGGLGFTIHRGAIPFALGDAFAFGVETGGRFRWRKDAGAWSADTAIADTVSLGEGLSAAFVSGASPSFVVSDLYRFAVRQPNSPNHVQIAHGDAWRWSGATATLTLTWPSDQTIAVVGLLRHGLSASATVSIALKNSGGTTLQTLTPAVGAGPLVSVLASPLATVRSIQISIANATGMSLGWVYAGQPFSTSHNASIMLNRSYALERGDGLNPRGAYLGVGKGGEIRWENWLLQSEFDVLLALVDACKADSDAPIVLLPNINHPADAALVRVDSDALEVSDVFDYQSADAARRRLSLTLPFAAVLA